MGYLFLDHRTGAMLNNPKLTNLPITFLNKNLNEIASACVKKWKLERFFAKGHSNFKV